MENHFGISEEEYWWKTFTSEAMDSTTTSTYAPLSEPWYTKTIE